MTSPVRWDGWQLAEVRRAHSCEDVRYLFRGARTERGVSRTVGMIHPGAMLGAPIVFTRYRVIRKRGRRAA